MVWSENLFKAELMGQCAKCMSWSCKLEDLSGDQLNTCRPDVVICVCNFDLPGEVGDRDRRIPRWSWLTWTTYSENEHISTKVDHTHWDSFEVEIGLGVYMYFSKSFIVVILLEWLLSWESVSKLQCIHNPFMGTWKHRVGHKKHRKEGTEYTSYLLNFLKL